MQDVDIDRLFPGQEEIEPDLELIKFGYATIMKGYYTSNFSKLMGMLKYIINSGDIKDYKEEYYLLYRIYQKLNSK